MRVLLSVVLLLFAVSSQNTFAQQQYTEATCLLLQQQIDRFAAQPESRHYLQAKREFNLHCQNPLVAPAKQAVLTNMPIKPVESKAAAVAAATGTTVLTATPDNTVAAPFKLDMGAMMFSLFQPYIPYILIFLLLLLLANMYLFLLFGSKARFLGVMAERQLHRLLLRHLPAGYQHYRNLILQTAQGDLTEIDHLVLSRFGIFVVEVKNYRGWIFGSELQPLWTVQHFRRKHSFQNPLRQNHKHTEAVKFALGLTSQESRQVHSVVAFSERAKLKTPLPAHVCYIRQVTDYIQQFTQPCFSDEQLRQFAAKLNLTASSQAALRKVHKQQVTGPQR